MVGGQCGWIAVSGVNIKGNEVTEDAGDQIIVRTVTLSEAIRRCGIEESLDLKHTFKRLLWQQSC